MSGGSSPRGAALRRVIGVAGLVVSFMAAFATTDPTRARAQEFDPATIVSDTTFTAGPRSPLSYQSDYIHDQVRGSWTQSLSYARAFKRTALNVNGTSNTSEDELAYGSRTTTGDIAGRVDWKAVSRLVLSLDGRYSMSSLADGQPLSTSNQRRNSLAIRSQYEVSLPLHMNFMFLGSSEFQRNFDLRFAQATSRGDTTRPDSVIAQRDSSYSSGRLDGARASLDWKMGRGFTLAGGAFGSWNRPTTTVRSLRTATPVNGTPGDDSLMLQKVQIPVDNSTLDGTLTFDQKKGTVAVLQAKRGGADQVYFDIGQLRVEQLSNDARNYNFTLTSALRPGLALNGAASLGRNLREFAARKSLNALTTAREATLGLAYSSAVRMAVVNMTVNRTRAERQATGNGITMTRALNTNFQQRLTPHLWLVGLGSANLNSYQYDFTPEAGRAFSKDDRDAASTFGSVGVRFGITPRCSTTVNFSASRQHSVALDASRSNGNLENTVYQLNGTLRIPLNTNLSIGQDYVLTATYRFFDFDRDNDDLSRLFRIDTTVADTLFPFAFIRMDHRYSFFDRGEFTPVEGDPNGPQFYGVSQEQAQQILEGTVGIRPLAGVTLTVKQSLSDTENRELVGNTHDGAEQWNLSLGLEVNRSFWNGAGLRASIKREDRYQTRSNQDGALFKEGYWLAGVTFQKDFQ